jgi:hypothetical protein
MLRIRSAFRGAPSREGRSRSVPDGGFLPAFALAVELRLEGAPAEELGAESGFPLGRLRIESERERSNRLEGALEDARRLADEGLRHLPLAVEGEIRGREGLGASFDRDGRVDFRFNGHRSDAEIPAGLAKVLEVAAVGLAEAESVDGDVAVESVNATSSHDVLSAGRQCTRSR